jgi:hypothetical protein
MESVMEVECTFQGKKAIFPQEIWLHANFEANYFRSHVGKKDYRRSMVGEIR